ncbi:MAG: dihydropteroate synthase [bacterium]
MWLNRSRKEKKKLMSDALRCRLINPTSAEDIRSILKQIGVDPWAVGYLSKKGENLFFLIDNIDNKAANILKQEMLSLGSDAGLNRNVSRFVNGKTSVLLFSSKANLEKLELKLKNQPFGLKGLSDLIRSSLGNRSAKEQREFKVGKKNFILSKKTVIFGILNITPDSFYDGGRYFKSEKAFERVKTLINEGADIIDVGGESTRPGAQVISVEEELRRVLPVVESVKSRNDVPVSVDTYKAGVAMRCLKKGAAMINDVSALRFDKEMVHVVKDFNVPIVLMHMKGHPRTMQKAPFYKDCISEIYSFFEQRIEYALKNGIAPKKIILDPGIGFGKRLEDNLEILKRINEFKSLGFPMLVGSSRKTFIGKILENNKKITSNLSSPFHRLEGTIASCLWVVGQGVEMLRVHDPGEISKAVAVYKAIKNQRIN